MSATSVIIGLSVVIVAADGDTPCVLVTRRTGDLVALPFGTFDPATHRTFELALRGWVREQTGFDLGYVEQLYTFGDRDRETPEATIADAPKNTRVVSVGYLGLTPDQQRLPERLEAKWRGWYSHFPWEDHRNGRPAITDDEIAPRLQTWAAGSETRQARANLAFGLDGQDWTDDRVLERYELLYEAGLVTECARDAGLPLPDIRLGEPMASDHRRILATAMGRLRGKIRYRPVVFELMPERFTLSALQEACEGLLGQRLHKQNFRRALDRTELVEGTGEVMSQTGGRPAELFRFRREKLRRSAALGISTPSIRRDS
ncbi:MAG: NAD regulator [Henriciella sp.]